MENKAEINKKYELLSDDSITLDDGTKLYRVRALRDFRFVKRGELGGFIQSEANLSQLGDCWVTSTALVFGNASVLGNALVLDGAKVYGNANVGSNAVICDFARVYEDATVSDNAIINGYARIFGECKIYGHSSVYNDSEVFGRAVLKGNTKVMGGCKIFDDAFLIDSEASGNSKIFGEPQLYKSASVVSCVVSGRAKISRAHLVNCIVTNMAEISVNLSIYGQTIGCKADYIIFKNWWSSGRYFAYFTQTDEYQVGCFRGNGEELISKAYEDSKLSGQQYEKIVKYVEDIKTQLKILADTNNSLL